SNPSLLYDYIPSRWVGMTMSTLFFLSTFVHTAQAARFRVWWMFPTTVLGGMLQTLGWAARLWSSWVPRKLAPYLIQLISLLIAGTPILAANFIVFELIVKMLGPRFSLVSPKLCAWLHVNLRNVRGIHFHSPVSSNSRVVQGGWVMLAGVVLQTGLLRRHQLSQEKGVALESRTTNAAISSAPASTAEPGGATYTEHIEDPPPDPVGRRLRFMIVAVILSSIFLFVRCVYRVLEFGDEWDSPVDHNQVYFTVLDGLMILLSVLCFNFVHPGAFL
ncbi:hypothetical protein FA15DRAFT_552280, partial [Coprinopsis marcescibilis]